MPWRGSPWRGATDPKPVVSLPWPWERLFFGLGSLWISAGRRKKLSVVFRPSTFQRFQKGDDEMALIDDVKQICDRLAPLGWGALLQWHGLNISRQPTLPGNWNGL